MEQAPGHTLVGAVENLEKCEERYRGVKGIIVVGGHQTGE